MEWNGMKIFKKWNGTEWNGPKKNEMEWNGTREVLEWNGME